MLFLVTGAEKELKAVASEISRIFIAGFHSEPIVALEIVRRFGSIHKVTALSAKEAKSWRETHNSTLSALPWRTSTLSDGKEWRTETELPAKVFLDLHRANYAPTQCIRAE